MLKSRIDTDRLRISLCANQTWMAVAGVATNARALARILFIDANAKRHVKWLQSGAFKIIVQVLNPLVDCSSCTSLGEASEAQDRALDASSKAFFWVMGGLQINYSKKLNVFAQYMLTSAASNFLLESNTHTLQGGVRLSFGTSKEGITERN